MKSVQFTKMEGAGNDYIYLYGMGDSGVDFPRLSIGVSDRHFGIGGDGIILIDPVLTEEADYRMRIFNADGSEAEMCGNGIRCVAKYLYDKHITDKTLLRILTGGGVRTLQLNIGTDGCVHTVRVDMGIPQFNAEPLAIEAYGQKWSSWVVRTGNPHAVNFVEDVNIPNFEAVGRAIETHPSFPEMTNVEFVQVIDPTHLRMRVWERGSGETMACGTGASASLVAAVVSHQSERKATLHLRGGDLEIDWDETSNHLFMTGPARIAFEGVFDLDQYLL